MKKSKISTKNVTLVEKKTDLKEIKIHMLSNIGKWL